MRAGGELRTRCAIGRCGFGGVVVMAFTVGDGVQAVCSAKCSAEDFGDFLVSGLDFQ
jgi:hypothetical protein